MMLSGANLSRCNPWLARHLPVHSSTFLGLSLRHTVAQIISFTDRLTLSSRPSVASSSLRRRVWVIAGVRALDSSCAIGPAR